MGEVPDKRGISGVSGTRGGRAALLAVALSVFPAAVAGAQWGVWRADSLLALGRLVAAESAYYAAVRAQPTNPTARAALGKFLSARGGTRAGAVLLEEAIHFGGDSAALSRSLAEMYVRLGDYDALLRLKPNVLSDAERRRAQWLAKHPSEAKLNDSIVIVSYRPVGDGRGLGTLLLRIGKAELPAVLDPRISGLVLPAMIRADARLFGKHGQETLGVIDSVRIGGAVFSHVPVTLGTPDEAARVGFDLLAPYFPGFDPTSNLLTLRRVNRRSPPPEGARVPALLDGNGLRVLIGGRWQSATTAGPAMLLATRRWIWDGRVGDVVMPREPTAGSAIRP